MDNHALPKSALDKGRVLRMVRITNTLAKGGTCDGSRSNPLPLQSWRNPRSLQELSCRCADIAPLADGWLGGEVRVLLPLVRQSTDVLSTVHRTPTVLSMVVFYLFGPEFQVRCTRCRGAFWSIREYWYETNITRDSCPQCHGHIPGVLIIDPYAKRRYTR